MRPTVWFLLLFLPACVSQTKETWRPAVGPETEIEVPPVGRARVWDRSAPPATETPPAPPGEEAPEPCRHAWVQVDWHTYWQQADGVPVQAICVINQCAKCGEVHHECRRAPEGARTRTPRSRTPR